MNCAAIIVRKDHVKTATLIVAGNTLKEDNLENIYLEMFMVIGLWAFFKASSECRKKEILASTKALVDVQR